MCMPGAATSVTALVREIERVGGLVGIGDLVEAWGVSKQRVHVLARRADFPSPVAVASSRPVWARSETDAWRAQQRLP
jgi:predicted DNA-binding transcriptional regulator AlpA